MQSTTEKRNELYQHVCDTINLVIQQFVICPSQTLGSEAHGLRQALNRLHKAVLAKNGSIQANSFFRETPGGLSLNQITRMQLLTFDEMLDLEICTYQNNPYFSKYQANDSLKEILQDCGKLTHVENELMPYGYVQNLSAQRLCELAQCGDFDGIKAGNVCHYQVNKLVSWAILGLPPTELGIYNAVMIAAAYRHTQIVKYFVEEKGEDLTQRGGRERDFNILDCAQKSWWLGKPVDQELITYLNNKLSMHQSMSSYT